MPRVQEDGNIVFAYDTSPRSIYWRKLTDSIIARYGRVQLKSAKLVKSVLFDVYDFLLGELRTLISEEKSLGFYLYVFWLHEQSLEVYFKQLKGYRLRNTSKSDFATYRRILKLVLEQGCDVNFSWPQKASGQEVIRMDRKIDAIFYLGVWAYHIADNIAYQKMIGDFYFTFFDEDNYLSFDYKYHYGQAYEVTVKRVVSSYSEGTFDEGAMPELVEELRTALNIDFWFSRNQIQEIKKFHSPNGPLLQTIEPYVLPLNLESNGVIRPNANLYYKGLTISRTNKLPIEEIIRRPYAMQRYLFRPILVYQIDGQERALVSLNKFDESFMVISTNAIHWNAMPEEWQQNDGMRAFMIRKGNEHDRVLEDKIEATVRKLGLPRDRNVTSMRRPGQNNINITADPGEIDFIIVSSIANKVFICEAKYNRARHEGVGYASDYQRFFDYEQKLEKKVRWARENLHLIQDHMSLVNGIGRLNLLRYEVQGVFFINTPTFYMFNGNFHAATLNRIEDLLTGNFDYPVYQIETPNAFMTFTHPFFRKPATI